MARYLLILNLGSGGNERGNDPEGIRHLIEARLLKAGHSLETRLVKPREIEAALTAAVKASPDVVIIAGGDGTVSTAARHLGGTGIALGILPMGTFNLAARDFGVPLEMENAVDFLVDAEALEVDVLDVAGHICLCTTIIGFYPQFAKTFERRDHGGQWWKKAWKVMTAMPGFFAKARAIRLEWNGDDGITGKARTKFTAFVPGRYKESAGLVPARTDFRSGKLSAYIGTHRLASQAVRSMVDFVIGRQEDTPELIHFQTSQLEIRMGRSTRCTVMLDGEILRLPLPLNLKILPLHLRVLTTQQHLEADTEP